MESVEMRYTLLQICGFWLTEYPDAHEDMVRRRVGEDIVEVCWWRDWDPINNLEQLKMVYETAEGDYPDGFAHSYSWAFCDLFKEKTGWDAGMYDMTTSWVRHPDLVAEAIKIAKEKN